MHEKGMKTAKANVSRILDKKFDAKGKTLDQQLRKARGHLPKHAREEVEFLIDAEHKLRHPILRKRVSAKQIEAVGRTFDTRSGRYNKEAERSKARYYWASRALLTLLASGLIFYALLTWIGAI
jgi:hypothetical protein